ncbi:MAG: hypothetical protein JEZ03_13845 [Bacteroidales bacterium]|nr:hypothetical protein [Bacteroidales bacterium]
MNKPEEPKNAKGDQVNEIDQIREIIVGYNLRELKRKLLFLENKINDSVQEVESKSIEKITQLDNVYKSLVEKSSELLTEKLSSNNEQMDDLTEKLHALEKSVNQLETSVKERISHVEQEYENKLKVIEQKGQSMIDDLKESFDSNIKELASHKMDRGALAGLMNELALQIDKQNTSEEDQNITND